MAALSLTRPVPPPNSSHALRCHPEFYAKPFENFQVQRKRRSFRLRDSSLASLLRMYEMLLCGLGKQLAQEADYFASQKWRVENIPDPTRVGWEHDLERQRICQAVAIVLVDAFNHQDISGESRGGVRLHSVPKWAQALLQHVKINDLFCSYPDLGHLYFYLPWRQLSFLHPPRSPCTIIHYARQLAGDYWHRNKLMSLPIFSEKDDILSSLCRAYELSVLANVVLEIADVYNEEINYLLKRLSSFDLADFPDPRTRWRKMDVTERDAFRGLVQFFKIIAEQMDPVKGKRLPSWVVDSCSQYSRGSV